MWLDIWLDNVKNLWQYILWYTVGNSLTSLITSHMAGWCAACNAPIGDETVEMH